MKNYSLYIHKTPDNMYYPGMTGQSIKSRWKPSTYKHSLKPYIEEFGWDNIEHLVVIDGLQKEQALYWEERLISMYESLGCCINKNHSGGWTKDKEKVKEHQKEYRQRPEVKEYQRDYNKEYRQRPEVKERRREYEVSPEILTYRRNRYKTNIKVKEYHLMKNKERRSTKVGKIYNRVNAYNQTHPDLKVITPAEAKEMYELTGYIPDFIKKDDLI